jgi:hypothetical protein
MKKSLFVFVIGISGLFFLGDWGLSFIGANATLINYRVMLLMGVVIFLERHHAMHAQVYVTTNKIPFYKSAIITAILNISLILFLLPRVDIWAFPIAQGISNLIINNWWNVYLSINSLNKRFIPYFKISILWPFISLIILSFLRILFNHNI